MCDLCNARTIPYHLKPTKQVANYNIVHVITVQKLTVGIASHQRGGDRKCSHEPQTLTASKIFKK